MNILLMCNTIARTLTDKGGWDKQNKWAQWFDHLSTLHLPFQHCRAMIVLPTPFKIIRPDVAKILPLKKKLRPSCKNKIFSLVSHIRTNFFNHFSCKNLWKVQFIIAFFREIKSLKRITKYGPYSTNPATIFSRCPGAHCFSRPSFELCGRTFGQSATLKHLSINI